VVTQWPHRIPTPGPRRITVVSARRLLDTANLYFCAMMAGLVGLLMGGWGWFAPAAVASEAASIHPGGIQLRPGPRHPRRRR
jgi:hypothetical protein